MNSSCIFRCRAAVSSIDPTFLLSRLVGLEGATIAITGAVILMIVAREDVQGS